MIVDKLYGGLDLVESLARKKVFCVAKCRADRPSWLFSKYLHKFIRSKNAQLGDYAAVRLLDLPFVNEWYKLS